MNWNLRNRIMTPMVGLVVLLTLVMSLAAFFMSRAMLARATDEQLEQISKRALTEVENWVDAQQKQLQIWATTPEVLLALQDSPAAANARPPVSRTAEFASGLYGCMENVCLTDAKGLIIAGADKQATGKLNCAEKSYFKEAMAGHLFVSEPMASRMSGNPVVVISVPVKDGDTVRGVVFSVLDLDWFSARMVSTIKIMETGYAYFYDRKGLFLAHPDKALILKQGIEQYDWGRQILQARNGRLDYVFRGVSKRVVFHTSGTLHWGIAVTAPHAELNAPVRHLTMFLSLLGLGSLIVAMAIAYMVARSISQPLQQVTANLSAGAAQTTDAAGHVSAASQSLAEGASQQAASLEESSASLEEMASMSKRNAENVHKANELARQSRTAADAAVTDIHAMSQAIGEMKASSGEIAKIIKTIDEIAFQTNILALNAAVEAARAGEAGMGFAVVAEEVRSLAQRSAQAAKETAAKIEGAITKTGQGVEISGKLARQLQEIVEKVRQVDQLVGEVDAAAKEQSQGIEQVNLAVGQMDKVTQSNAASAEESASAAEELNAQAATLKEAITQLLRLIDGRRQEAGKSADKAAKETPAVLSARGQSAPSNSLAPLKPARNPDRKRAPQHNIIPTLAAAGRRQQIPMDDDFKDF